MALAFVITTTLSASAAEIWVALTPPAFAYGTSALAADPAAPDILYGNIFYAASGDSGIARSVDGGRTWTVLPFTARFLIKIIAEANGPNRVTALSSEASGYSVYRSADGGLTWARHQFSPGVVGVITDLAVHPADANILYASHDKNCFAGCIPDSGGVSRSVDGGRHWSTLFKGTAVAQILIDPLGSGTVYAPGAISKRSDDGGSTWTNLTAPEGEPIVRMVLDPVVPEVLYASTGRGFFRSDDGGATWVRLVNPFGFYAALSIAVDPTQRNAILLGGQNAQGAAMSLDGGVTWQPANKGLIIAGTVSQLDWIRVFFSSDGQAYGFASFHGAMRLETIGPRRRAVRK